MKERFCRAAIIILASIGILGVGRISINHWTGEASCPMIGPLPACYIILIGYSLIVLSVYPGLQQTSLLFLIGWVPVITLALIGVVGELTDIIQCPQLENGLPQCYLSAVLALILGLIAWLLFRIQSANVDS